MAGVDVSLAVVEVGTVVFTIEPEPDARDVVTDGVFVDATIDVMLLWVLVEEKFPEVLAVVVRGPVLDPGLAEPVDTRVDVGIVLVAIELFATTVEELPDAIIVEEPALERKLTAETAVAVEPPWVA